MEIDNFERWRAFAGKGGGRERYRRSAPLLRWGIMGHYPCAGFPKPATSFDGRGPTLDRDRVLVRPTRSFLSRVYPLELGLLVHVGFCPSGKTGSSFFLSSVDNAN